MPFRNRKRDDDVTHSLLRSGVYRLQDFEDEEAKKFRGADTAYSFWSAVKYTFVLTILLWWLPIFGQMIAGYVGGRRAGTPMKAIIAALMPLLVILVISYGFDSGLFPSEVNGIIINPEMLMNGAGDNMPFVGPYITFATMYINSLMGAVQSVTLLKVDNYIVTIAFAYIGGIIADQTRRELEFVASHSGHETNIVVSRDNTVDVTPTRARGLRYTRPQLRAPEDDIIFEDMSNIEVDAAFEEVEEAPVRTTRGRIGASSKAPIGKKKAKQKAKLVERVQKDVGRKARSRSPVNGLVARSAKKPALKPHAHKGEQEGQGGWEYI